MGVVEILEQWVKPITGPLDDFYQQTLNLAQIHQDSVNTFNTLAQDLTDTNAADAFTGDGANNFVEMTGDYLISETELSGNVLGLAGPLADAGSACTTMVTSVGEGVTVAVEAGPAVDALVDATTVIDVTTAAQGGLDVPEDVVAGASTALVILTVIAILTALALVIYTSWLIWQSCMNSIANTPMPKLPRTPSMSNTSGTTNSSQTSLTLQQQQIAEELYNEFGGSISLADIQDIIAKNPGLTKDQYHLLVDYYRRTGKKPYNVVSVFSVGINKKGKPAKIFVITQGDITHVRSGHMEFDSMNDADLAHFIEDLLQRSPDGLENGKSSDVYIYDEVEIDQKFYTVEIVVSTTNPGRIITTYIQQEEP